MTWLNSLQPVWEVAQIISGDSEAISKYNAIINDKNFPSHIQPKGTITGDFTSVNYDAQDNDCWWSYKKCTQPKVEGLSADIVRCPEPNTLGFTVDDGPNATHNAYYDFLRDRDVKATMYYVGSNVYMWQDEAKRGLGEGHEVSLQLRSMYATEPMAIRLHRIRECHMAPQLCQPH